MDEVGNSQIDVDQIDYIIEAEQTNNQTPIHMVSECQLDKLQIQERRPNGILIFTNVYIPLRRI